MKEQLSADICQVCSLKKTKFEETSDKLSLLQHKRVTKLQEQIYPLCVLQAHAAEIVCLI